jgi:hypothetical protein
MFLNKVRTSYTLVIADNLDHQLTELAKNIIDLDFSEAEEKKLLETLKATYDSIKGRPSQATADVNWDAVIRENMAKKKALKQRRIEENKRAMLDSRLVRRPPQMPEPAKRQVAHEVEKLGNIVTVDFTKQPLQQVGLPRASKKEDRDFGERLTRIRSSLEKINRLMAELKSIAMEEGQKKAQAPALKVVKKKSRSSGKKKVS